MRRFFDIDFRLPALDREQFVGNLLETTQLKSILANVESQAELRAVKALLEAFLGSPELSLRRVQQATYRLRLMFVLLSTDSALYALTAVIAIVLRTVDFAVYQRFIGGTATDEEVAHVVFRLPETASLRRGSHGMLIESYIILGLLPMTAAYGDYERGLTQMESPLLQQYRKLQEVGIPDNADTKRAGHLLQYLQERWQKAMFALEFEQTYREFLESIQRLELLSPEQGENSST